MRSLQCSFFTECSSFLAHKNYSKYATNILYTGRQGEQGLTGPQGSIILFVYYS